MPNDVLGLDAEKVQWLSGTLIVLSLVLLYCWNSKKESYVPVKGGYMYGYPRQTDGFSAKRMNAEFPHLHLNKNLNDLENYVVNRHPASKERMHSDVSGMKWQSHAFVSGRADEDQYGSGYDEEGARDRILTRRAEELVGYDILTPTKPDLSACNEPLTTGAMQILNADNTPHFSRTVTV